jgi:hypothetical protein
MQQRNVDLPNGSSATLLYLHEYQQAKTLGLPVIWLQIRKLKRVLWEEQYKAMLDRLTASFAQCLCGMKGHEADVVLLPASGSRLFDPYVAKLQEMTPGVSVYSLFTKPQEFEAGVDHKNYNTVFDNTMLDADVPDNVIAARTILIIDDIFNTGNTPAAMLARLLPRMKCKTPAITIACVLYVAVENTINGNDGDNEFEWQATMHRILAEEE